MNKKEIQEASNIVRGYWTMVEYEKQFISPDSKTKSVCVSIAESVEESFVAFLKEQDKFNEKDFRVACKARKLKG